MAQQLPEIVETIKQMGYIVPNFQKPTPSFYQLQNGDILAVLIRVHYILPNGNDINPIVNSTTDCYAFTKRRKALAEQQMNMSPSISQSNLKFKVLLEEFNPFRLSNGSIFNVKTVLSQVDKMNIRTQNGEPVYNIRAEPIYNIDEV